MNVVWTDEERDVIRKNAGTLTDSELAKRLTESTGREVSLQSVRKQRQKMNLKKCHGRGVCRLVVNDSGVTPKPRGVSIHIEGSRN